MEEKIELLELERQIARKDHISSKLKCLKERASVLGSEVLELRKKMEYEQTDVDRLEGFNTVSVFYTIIGKKVEELEKQKKEALIAVEKFKMANSELESLLHDVDKCERELRYITRCEEKYAELWDRLIADTSQMQDAELGELQRECRRLEARLKDIDEALCEGEKAFELCDEIIEYIAYYYQCAENRRYTSEAQMIDAHEKLKLADNKLGFLPIQLSRFRAELADVEITLDLSENEESYQYSIVGASNYYVDLFTVNNNTRTVYSSVRELKGRVSKLIFGLSERKTRLKKNYARICEKIKDKI